MMDSSFSKTALKAILTADFQLSGDDLEAMVDLVETNVADFAKSVGGLLADEEWDELYYGAERCKALGENMKWPALSEAGFTLEQGAKAKNRLAVTQAAKTLRELIVQMKHDPSVTAPTIRFRLD
ncbi:MAG: hypothetical protein RRC34_14705 [Lentisphaeria bacterium]|nr:hypothetical protein [Lentisphaeria bacterium]